MKDSFIEFLRINEDELQQLKSISEKVMYLYTKYKNVVFYDTTENFLRKKLFFVNEEAFNNIKNGLGCSCQELHFLFKELLSYFNIDSRLVHCDIIDNKLGILKKMYGTALWIDTSCLLMIDIMKDEIYTDDCELNNCLETKYEIEKSDDIIEIWNNSNSRYKYYMNVDENYRINRLVENYSELTINPFGVIAPFYWTNNPHHKVFYQPFKDVMRIYENDDYIDFDLLEWTFVDETKWLTNQQKSRIKKCLAIISLNVDSYQQLSIINNNFEFL